MLHGASHKPHIGLNHRQSEGCSLFLGKFQHKDVGESSSILFVKWPKLSLLARGCLVLAMWAWIHSLRHSTRSGIVLHLGWALPAATGLVDGAVLALGQNPAAGVEHHWSVSLFGGICLLVTEGAGGCWVLLYSLVASSPKKLAKSAGNHSMSPRSPGRSSQTCFGAGSGGKCLRETLAENPNAQQWMLRWFLAALSYLPSLGTLTASGVGAGHWKSDVATHPLAVCMAGSLEKRHTGKPHCAAVFLMELCQKLLLAPVGECSAQPHTTPSTPAQLSPGSLHPLIPVSSSQTVV